MRVNEGLLCVPSFYLCTKFGRMPGFEPELICLFRVVSVICDLSNYCTVVSAFYDLSVQACVCLV